MHLLARQTTSNCLREFNMEQISQKKFLKVLLNKPKETEFEDLHSQAKFEKTMNFIEEHYKKFYNMKTKNMNKTGHLSNTTLHVKRIKH